MFHIKGQGERSVEMAGHYLDRKKAVKSVTIAPLGSWLGHGAVR